MKLSEKSCVPCQGGVPSLSQEEAESLLAQTPGWSLTQEGTRLERRFAFKSFAAALEFVNRVGEIAEQEDHHPDISFGWGYATVVYYTHKIGGLHENDFVMAAKLNTVYG
ncbi:MAG: 4a-hydroxytetrahydrobiopterin dehydratase [Candidatus Competibacteraceae bacterium]|nr:4a-hydroxytetrahydrobiopterin dehydratase [Candidatus Competibacteraceae bacterium]